VDASAPHDPHRDRAGLDRRNDAPHDPRLRRHFSAVVAKHAGRLRPADYNVPAADIAAYVASAVSVEDPNGKHAPLVWVGLRRTGDLMWITMRVPSVRALRGVKLASTLLFENFDDQVNIVQTTYDGHRHSMLFTAGDGHQLKPIP